MSFSAEWNERYKANTHMSIWPWSDLVSLVIGYGKPKERALRVLELGMGAGANIPFFQVVANEYCGIEGSSFIVERLQTRFPELRDNLRCGDFTREIPFSGPFDIVADRSSLTHNTTADIKRCLGLVRDKLAPGGMFIGVDWFSTEYSRFKEGIQAEDAFTRTGYESGAMAKVGRVHFSDERHLRELFEGFDFVSLEHKVVQRKVPNDGWYFAAWNFVAVVNK